MTRLDRVREIIGGSGRGGRTTNPRGAPPPAPTLTPRPEAAGSDSASDSDIDVLGGTLEPGPDGPTFTVRRTYPAADLYGRRPLGEYPPPSVDALDILAAGGGEIDRVDALRGVVCLDLETTGLSGGAGTVGFIVGVGWFEAGAFVTCQYFLGRLPDERRLLRSVAEGLRHAHTIVTFNGKSFDAPVIETRYAFHRLCSPLESLRHVDLLHPCRHLWVGQTRLVSLERAVLGLRRVGDVPGAEIPGRYVTYLRDGDARRLALVLEHNRLDLVSLGVLTGLACRLVRDGAEAADRVSQALGLGRVYEKVGRHESAVTCYRRAARFAPAERFGMRSAVVATVDMEARAQALGRLAGIYRRQRRYAEAADAWVRLLALPRVPDRLRREASVALAVHHEHRLRDPRQAQWFAKRALDVEPHPKRRRAVEHRLTRLRRKIDATPRMI